MNSGHWFETLRAILELLYFIAGIAIAGAAFFGLRQIKLTKRIATKNAKREDLKFAAERCQYYAENVVVLHAKLLEEHKKLGLTFLTTPVQFEIINGDVVVHDKSQLDSAREQMSKVSGPLVRYLNSLEAFAIPFAAGVADDEIGFQETASVFCRQMPSVIGAIVQLRKLGSRYQSSIKLYDCWNKRLETEDLKKKMKDLENKIKATDAPKIKPVGGV